MLSIEASDAVAVVTDYLAQESLQRLQDEFVSALGLPIRVCSPAGEPLTRPSPVDEPANRRSSDAADVPIQLEGELLGRIVVPAIEGDEQCPDAESTERMLRLMASVIARRWNRQRLLRTRIAELATMYRLTAEFTGRRSLQAVLDLVARTVTDLLGAKACSLRMLNPDRKELKIAAVANLSQEYLTKGPILISESVIDQEVIRDGRTVYIPDMRSDERVRYTAEARREGIVSGLCAPLVYKGDCEGVLRVYMAEQHEFDWYERSLLQAVAAQAAAAIVNARLYQEAVRGANLQRHVNMAAEVQRRMFPAEPPRLEGFEIATHYTPCFELGGDFYDFHRFDAQNAGVAVCDVVGKGVRASLLMASLRASLRAHASNIYELSEVVSRVNTDLCADTAISDFATLFYGVIDAGNRRFTYANAGHTPALLVRDGACCHLTTGGGVLGLSEEFTWRHDSMMFAPGDLILIYTDGLTEALNFDDEQFGLRRVEQTALAAIGKQLNAEGILRHVLWELHHHTGLQTQLDDLTLVAIRAL